MAFTTQTFLFLFFPLSLAVYYFVHFLQKIKFLSPFLSKIRATDLCLIGIGCIFYMWACVDDLFRLLLYIGLVYVFGWLIDRKREHTYCVMTEPSGQTKKISAVLPVLFIGLACVIYILVRYKYMGILTSMWNFMFKDTQKAKSVIALLGISFITFSAISYLADIYKGKARCGSLIDCALYITFFPKVVSGPIVLWRDFMPQTGKREIGLTNISDGITRIMIGFAKKLILADTFGACIGTASQAIDVPTAFGFALLYMLQIYFDFSGYSDIAIGLANMLGFNVKENFNFPYLSCSITEFWRRWHISLGTWFREYVYFPLGGSRKGKGRTIFNIGVVFVLTGIWHGAGWAYMLWGIINGLCNIAEKLLADNKLYQKIPRFIKWLGTMIVTYFCWILFRFGSITEAIRWLMVMFGLKRFDSIPYAFQYYFDTRMVCLVAVAILGSTVWGWPKVHAAYQKCIGTRVGYAIHSVILLCLFVIAIMFMVNSQYSPFIYFQY